MSLSDYINQNFHKPAGNDRDPTGHGNFYQQGGYEAPAIDVKGLSLLSIDLVVTGTYRQEFLRPYMVSTTRDDINRIADYTAESGGMVSDTLLAGVAGKVMNYSNRVNNADVVDIENGMDTRRLSFIIEVIEREFDDFNNAQDIVTEISGFTDRIDAVKRSRLTRGTSNNDQEILIAPDTRFYITNISRVNKRTSIVVANNQLIVPSYYRGNTMNGRHDSLYITRPRDVFVAEGVNAVTSNERYGTSVTINQANKLIGTVPKPSRYTNLTPASYLSASINALSSSESTQSGVDQFGTPGAGRAPRENVMRIASGLLRENTGYEANSFLTLLRDEVSRFGTNTVFQWSDLHKVFGYDAIEDITSVHNFDSNYDNDSRMSRVDGDLTDHNDMENGGRNAVMFTVLRQALPGLAFQHGIQACVIEATNILSNTDRMDAHQGIKVNIYDVIWTHQYADIDQERRRRNMEQDVAIRVLLDASINNAFDFDIAVDLEWRFDSFYRIGIDGGRMLEFSTAGFAGALSSPVVSSSLDLTEALGRELRSIVDNVLGR